MESLLRSTVSEKELMSSFHLTNGLAGYRILVLKFLYFNTENFLINPLLLFRSLILISFLLLCNFFFRKDLEFTPLLLKSTVMSVVTSLRSVLCLAFFVSKTLPLSVTSEELSVPPSSKTSSPLAHHFPSTSGLLPCGH